ncbi:MAG: glycoside hydrolase family 2 TIM barrel-domain containing protein [Rikenellaceae bacterium]
MNLRKFLLLFLTFFTAFSLFARERSSFNQNWKFKLIDGSGIEAIDYNDQSWRTLSVPHDWSIEGEYDKNNPMTFNCGYLPAGIGWYRKTVDVPKSWIGKHVEIAFDGVFMNSTVWFNGKEMGTRPYGWSSFSYVVPEELKKSGEITVAVRVDNDLQPAARWYTGSGIYGNTWVDVKEPIHVPRSGVYVHTKGDKAFIETEISNLSANNSDITIVSSIRNGEGKIVASDQQNISLNSNATTTQKQEITIDNPAIWSPESPNLYTLVTTIKKGKKVVDEIETRFGVRELEWVAKTGMWLNGKNVKLQGVCLHADFGALGVVVSDKIIRFRIQQLLDMGCNAVRTSHYPRTPEFYNICDEMGMLVMDEVFDGWHKKVENEYAVRFFADWWERDITDWLKRDRNHPSIVIWSVGNETHGKEIAENLVATCHKYDSTRPVTSGHCENETMDVYGVNGGSENRGFIQNLDIDQPFIGTENTHTFHIRGFYRSKMYYRDGLTGKGKNAHIYPDLTDKEVFTNDWTTLEKRENPKNRYFSSYDNATIRLNARQNIEFLRDIPHFSGTFRWTGYDYIGEAKYHGGWPFKGLSSGAIDMANFPKDLFYLYQSQWTKEPMVHILPHWTHPNIKEGTQIPVWAYSNCDEVELFFNDKSLGKQILGKKWNEMNGEWLVAWKPGKIEVVGYKNGKEVAREKIETADAPSKIALSVDGEPMAEKCGDVTQVRVTTTDSKGEFYPYGENRSYYYVLGDGKVRALDNGSLNDTEKHYEATDRLAFYGLTRAYIESTTDKGDINLVVASILGEKRQITSKSVSIDYQTINLRGKAIDPEVEIYYTTDGSQPSKNSKKYNGSFDVALGTTVKAIVYVEDQKAWTMEERFAEDEGFEWYVEDDTSSVAGDQAEDAKIQGATVAKDGEKFVGQGFVEMNASQDSSIEWYYENDGSEGAVEVEIRYSVKGEDCTAIVNVNGVEKNVKLASAPDEIYKKYWTTVKQTFNIGRGGNTIIITTSANKGVCIDEIILK